MEKHRKLGHDSFFPHLFHSFSLPAHVSQYKLELLRASLNNPYKENTPYAPM
jgi:hypothetical protein